MAYYRSMNLLAIMLNFAHSDSFTLISVANVMALALIAKAAIYRLGTIIHHYRMNQSGPALSTLNTGRV